MDMREINRLIQTFSDHGLTCLELEEGNMRIAIQKEPCQMQQVTAAGATAPGAVEPGQTAFSDTALPDIFTEPSENGAQADGDASDSRAQDGQRVISAPLVGMFYNAASPEDAPFVKAGDVVKKGQVVGIIEAMKLMNEITSEADGVVKEVLAENGQVVEYGQPLFILG